MHRAKTYMMGQLTREEIINRATDLKVIPTLNGIVEKIFGILGNNNASFNDLREVVQYDQAVSSKIISIANSAYYSRGVEIFDLQRAMLTIGFEEVRGIVTCLMFMENILRKLKLKDQDLFYLWKHSIEVAHGARILSERMLVDEPPKTYTVALLHDIGKLVFFLSSDKYADILKEAALQGKDVAQIEKETFGIDHQEIGYIMAVKWKFPSDFAHIIRYHHMSQSNGQYESLFRIVREADRFAHSTHDQHSPEGVILEKEKNNLAKEVEKIVTFLHLD